METRGKSVGGDNTDKWYGANVRTASHSRKGGANHNTVLRLADGLASYPIRREAVRNSRRTRQRNRPPSHNIKCEGVGERWVTAQSKRK